MQASARLSVAYVQLLSPNSGKCIIKMPARQFWEQLLGKPGSQSDAFLLSFAETM
jgi:hypothetical protein